MQKTKEVINNNVNLFLLCKPFKISKFGKEIKRVKLHLLLVLYIAIYNFSRLGYHGIVAFTIPYHHNSNFYGVYHQPLYDYFGSSRFRFQNLITYDATINNKNRYRFYIVQYTTTAKIQSRVAVVSFAKSKRVAQDEEDPLILSASTDKKQIRIKSKRVNTSTSSTKGARKRKPPITSSKKTIGKTAKSKSKSSTKITPEKLTKLPTAASLKDKDEKMMIITRSAQQGMNKKRSHTGIKDVKQKGVTKTKRSISKKSSQHVLRSPKDLRWEKMIRLLRLFQIDNGHALVTVHDDVMYPGLYQWTLSLRRNYRYQVQQSLHSPMTESTLASSDSNVMILETNSSSTSSSKRPRLSNHKIQQLMECNFPWDVQDILWKRRYQELRQFYIQNGHCNVPINYFVHNSNKNLKHTSNTTFVGHGLGVWVQNQRSEYKKYQSSIRQKIAIQQDIHQNLRNMKAKKKKKVHGQASITLYSRLTPERIALLERLNFQGFRSHDETWNGRYQQLKQFYEKYNHTNVPRIQVFSNQYAALGMWCNNQRTAYRLYRTGNHTSNMKVERIEKLEQLDFQWHFRKSQWYNRLNRLKEYYQQYGHIAIPTDDETNRDLRLWLSIQRYHYNCIQIYNADGTNDSFKTPLTTERIQAIEEAVPNFSWKGRGTNGSGPSSEDWANLFDAMRSRGIQPGVRPKQHWFQGMNSRITPIKDRYTEQDLLELWYQEEDEYKDDNVNLSPNLSKTVSVANQKLKKYTHDSNRNQTGWSVTGKTQNVSPTRNNKVRNYVEWQPDMTDNEKKYKKKKLPKSREDNFDRSQVSINNDVDKSTALDSLLNTEQVLRQRQTYSDLLKDEDEYDAEIDGIVLRKGNKK